MSSAKGMPDSDSADLPIGPPPLHGFGQSSSQPPLPPPLATNPIVPPKAPSAQSSTKPRSPETVAPRPIKSPKPTTPATPAAPEIGAPDIAAAKAASLNITPPKSLPTAAPTRAAAPAVSPPILKSTVAPRPAAPVRGAAPAPPPQAEPEEETKSVFSWRDFYRDSPAWLTSLVVHMLIVIILGLVYIAPRGSEILELVASISQNGNNSQLDHGLDIETPNPPILEEDPIFAPDGKLTDSPLVKPLDVAPDPLGQTPTDPTMESSFETIGEFYAGREAGSKTNLAIQFGATKGTIDSVSLALEWIVKNQIKAGHWSLEKPYSGGAAYENRNAATAMALIALQGDGNTHLRGPYKTNVAAGLKVLLRSQANNGALHQGSPSDHQFMYTHSLATIALCELYAMSQDSSLREPCEKAVKYLVSVQSAEGGWRYRPGSESDLSVTGWCVMALQSARAAKLNVPNETFANIDRFLGTVRSKDGYQFGYLPRLPPTFAMTAEGLLCKQLMGMKRKDPALSTGVGLLLQYDDLKWEKGDGTHSVYGWYYATQVLHHFGGDPWEEWNNQMRVILPANQIKNGAERGSWSPTNDIYGNQAGRLYQTCLCTYMLEVYWRHLPIYREVYENKPAPAAKAPPAKPKLGEEESENEEAGEDLDLQ